MSKKKRKHNHPSINLVTEMHQREKLLNETTQKRRNINWSVIKILSAEIIFDLEIIKAT